MNQNTLTLARAEDARRAFMTQVYGWMCAGLTVTALVATYMISNPAMMSLIVHNSMVFFGLIIGELALVVGLSAAINRMSAATATMVFVIYSAVNGMTLSVIFLIYTAASISSTFFITAGTFGVFAIYGTITKADLTSVGNLCFMALIGIIIASIVNMFMHSNMMYWIITYLGVAIFVGLTAYDAQKIKRIGASVDVDSESGRKTAILGALSLYLDFINLFLFMLRLFGRRR
jgi:uncharacterized protein